MDDLAEKYGDLYSEIINKVGYDLQTNNKKYRRNINKCVEIMDKYPNVRKVCEDKIAVELTKDEVKALIKYIECDDNKETMKGKKLLYMGGRIAYTLMKNADLIKDTKIDE